MAMNWFVLVSVTAAMMALAMVWFWTLFWKLWMKIHGWEKLTKKQLKKQEEWIWKLLVVEAISTFIMVSILSYFLYQLPQISQYILALLIWWGFMVPNVISGVIWWADKKEYYLHKILILSGFNILALMISALLLTTFA